jgi:hypothetical protein
MADEFFHIDKLNLTKLENLRIRLNELKDKLGGLSFRGKQRNEGDEYVKEIKDRVREIDGLLAAGKPASKKDLKKEVVSGQAGTEENGRRIEQKFRLLRRTLRKLYKQELTAEVQALLEVLTGRFYGGGLINEFRADIRSNIK